MHWQNIELRLARTIAAAPQSISVDAGIVVR